jgi:hypothetical protein
MLGLCLVAALSIAAVIASTASAGPQWIKCEKIGATGGKYSGPNCTKSEKAKRNSGAYELFKAKEVEKRRVEKGKSPSIPFTGHNVGSGGVLYTYLRECDVSSERRITRKECAEKGGALHNGFEISIECSSENNTGEVSGSNAIKNVEVVFRGCVVLGSAPCQNTSTPGEIVVNSLKGELGYINKAKHEVGVLLEPVKKHGTFAEFNCGAEELFTVVGVGNKKEGTSWEDSPGVEKHGGYDGIIAPITPVNQMSSEFEQKYTVNLSPFAFENVPNSFEGKHISLLEDYVTYPEKDYTTQWSSGGEEVTNVNKAEEAGEIQA